MVDSVDTESLTASDREYARTSIVLNSAHRLTRSAMSASETHPDSESRVRLVEQLNLRRTLQRLRNEIARDSVYNNQPRAVPSLPQLVASHSSAHLHDLSPCLLQPVFHQWSYLHSTVRTPTAAVSSADMTSDSGATASRPVPVAILGCTGVVGQKFIALLQGHAYFRIVSLCASERSAGRQYGSAVSWKLSTALPASCAVLTVTTCDVASVQQTGAEVVFSALDASVAGERTAQQRWSHDRRLSLAHSNSPACSLHRRACCPCCAVLCWCVEVRLRAIWQLRASKCSPTPGTTDTTTVSAPHTALASNCALADRTRILCPILVVRLSPSRTAAARPLSALLCATDCVVRVCGGCSCAYPHPARKRVSPGHYSSPATCEGLAQRRLHSYQCQLLVNGTGCGTEGDKQSQHTMSHWPFAPTQTCFFC